MGLANLPIVAFNRGIISPLALARVDLARTPLSAEIQTNWMPRALGSMMLRPGLQYLGATTSNAQAYFIPFVFATTDTALIEVTNLAVRVWVDDALLTRASVSSAVANGTFDTDLTSWTDNDESGGVSAWESGGYLGLTGNGTAAAIRDQQVTVAGGDQNTEHALRVIIQRGPVTIRVGSSSGDDDYIEETTLRTGEHSLAFTPTGDFHVRFLSRVKRLVLVDSVAVESSGTLSITAPWATADLSLIRYDQSADVVYVACAGYQQRRIERRANNSWSVVRYQSDDGPFRLENVGPITLTASALSGNTSLTASAALFKSTHVGALFRVTSSGQTVTASATAENQFTNAIRVTGVTTTRIFQYTISGTWTATVTLQRSLSSSSGPWEDVETKTVNTTTSHDDGLDNQIAWYRIGVATGDFTSGTVVMTINYAVGSVDGICRVTNYTSATVVGVEILTDLGGTAATDIWAEGEWSDYRGWPSAVTFAEGRLLWAGKNAAWLSVSDGYDSFDASVEGDSGPISRSIGSGPVDQINWAIGLQRVILGAEGAELSIRSSGFDEPLTPTEFVIKPASTQGSAAVAAVQLDSFAIFVQKSGIRVFELLLDLQRNDYQSVDLTIHAPEIGEPSITRLAIQRQPDTRIHCVRSDGTAAVLLRDSAENVLCWVLVETDGVIEDVVVLPSSDEDAVYYVVKRTINSTTVRYLERWAQEDHAHGAVYEYSGASTTALADLPYTNGRVVTVRNSDGDKVENLTVTNGAATLSTASTYAHLTPATYRLADSFLYYSGSATSTITVSHLEGESVVVFADGKWRGSFTVSGGSITLSESVQDYVVGLTYRARYKSAKLAYAAGLGTALTQRKAVSALGLIMRDVHASGIKYGPDFDNLDDLPLIEKGAEVDVDHVWPEYDMDMMEFIKTWSTDSRLCLEANAPKPCTVLAGVVGLETHDRA